MIYSCEKRAFLYTDLERERSYEIRGYRINKYKSFSIGAAPDKTKLVLTQVKYYSEY